ncbi:L-alanine-DL-glutamate epimerase-like enolase superfamily enzyme [Luteibacter rhizovicinus]|uniref:Dipeptide epimerase n=1 Tax=Luteibacter rhizovicinus TaxID=242606 RepID=A0A4R3YX71_9GAMM|nr:dipeptide epimerase [Luteibacter rhizovicinus]TCV97777.1 L-alanine-DL-glutamate epimerase-like enolase superfamily enzyme [Luteibacter rhizovicinus]
MTSHQSPLALSAHIENLPLKQPFHITGYTFTECDALIVTLHDGEFTGRGEGLGVYYRHDTPISMLRQIEALRDIVEGGVTREQLLSLLPAGGARNALDCALWDLEARRRNTPVWKLAGMSEPRPLLTTYTLSADDPDVVESTARQLHGARAIKLKLTNDHLNAERVRAVRAACPDAWLMVDANQGFTRETLRSVLPALVEAGVSVIEQPFPFGYEAWLDGFDCPIPFAADESVQDRTDLSKLVGRVEVINIKLDKCGGLTAGLALAREASELGFQLMVGNMGGSSWSMGPAFVLGSLCSVVDLDGPMFISIDRDPGVSYRDGRVWCPDEVWGGPHTVTV